MGSTHIRRGIIYVRSTLISIVSPTIVSNFGVIIMVKNIKKDIKDEKMKTKERGSHYLYDEPGVVGSLGGMAPDAKAQKISIVQAKKELEKNLAYTLHKPRRREVNFYLWWCSTLINNG